MLQQTQVQVVIPYFLRFIERFPDLTALADSSLDQVMQYWAGLGYYARARHAHHTAQQCVQQHGGDLPSQYEDLCALPGIGPSTAGAILAQAWNQPFPILDGNVKRIFCRIDGIEGDPGQAAVNRLLWQRARQRIVNAPEDRIADYTQAQMDLGATLCTRQRPRCLICPLNAHCVAFQQDKVLTLPRRKPSKPLPERSACALVSQNGAGEILLQRRPATGIWASLWTLPQLEDATALRRWSRVHLSHAHWRSAKQLTSITHTFSHYHLSLDVWFILTPGLHPDLTDTSHFRWVHPCQSTEIGLPAPIRQLFSLLCQPQPS